MNKPAKVPQVERPHWPEYGVDGAQKADMMDWSWAEEALEKSRNYWINSTRADGRPHAMPVWGLWYEGQLFFGSGRKSVKSRNLLADPRAVVHLESGDNVVILEGTMAEITDPKQYIDIFKQYAKKYTEYEPPDHVDPQQVLFVFSPITALAWTEQSYPRSVTRWRFV